MLTNVVQNRSDPASLSSILMRKTITLYNGSGADIAAGIPVQIDPTVSTQASGASIKANVGTFGGAIGAPLYGIANGAWGEVVIEGPQDGVAVEATVAAYDLLGSNAGSTLGIAESAIRTTRNVIAAAAVRTLNATPVVAIAAPGANKYIHVLRAHWFLDFNSAAYDSAAAGDALSLLYGAAGVGALATIAGNTIGAAAADYHALAIPVAVLQPLANTAIYVALAAGEWYAAAGDSPLRYEIDYQIRSLDFSAASVGSFGQRPNVAMALSAYAAGTASVLWMNPLSL